MTQLVFYHQHAVRCEAFGILQQAIQSYGDHRIVSEFNEFLIDVYALSDFQSSRIVAIDYDNTITADPSFYTHLIQVYRELAWQPVVCTMRCAEPETLVEIRVKLRDEQIPIYTTDGQVKRPYMLEQGIRVGLWIDDMFPAVACPGAWLLRINGIDY